MRLSIIIPTCGRPDKISQCLRALGDQSLPFQDYEVLVGVDEDNPELVTHIERLWVSLAPRGNLYVDCATNVGRAGVHKRLLPRARADTLLILNDDVIPDHTMLEAHLRAQDRFTTLSSPVLVIGDSPFVVHEPDTLFAQLLRETSMIFFYNRMQGFPPDHDFGFRHAWTMNLSVSTQLVRDAGGLSEFPSAFLEDDELAYRLCTHHNARVIYAKDARAPHDHPMDPDGYLVRELRHGYSAYWLAQKRPECAQAMYSRDMRTDGTLDEFRSLVREFESELDPALEWFRSLDDSQPIDPASENVSELLDEHYRRHLPLKRHCWRLGFIGASEDQAMPTGLQRSLCRL
ncbi:MAG: glycosyltransferase family 2 protein [Phycisphaerales bacterium JB043]